MNRSWRRQTSFEHPSKATDSNFSPGSSPFPSSDPTLIERSESELGFVDKTSLRNMNRSRTPVEENKINLEDSFHNLLSRRPSPTSNYDLRGTTNERMTHPKVSNIRNRTGRNAPLLSSSSFGDSGHMKQIPDPLQNPTREECHKNGHSTPDVAMDLVAQKLAAYAPHSRSRPSQCLEIEIAPRVFARVRGAEETWECIRCDFYMPAACMCCNLDLCCIQDADFVLCPRCRVISPMDGMDPSLGYNGGVGLGFTMDDLHRWQHELLMQSNQTR